MGGRQPARQAEPMNTTTGRAPSPSDSGTVPVTEPPPRRLYRARQHRMLAGVASGIARYAGVDVAVTRIAFAVLALLGGAGLPLYLACWLLMPDEGRGQSIAAGVVSDLRASARNL